MNLKTPEEYDAGLYEVALSLGIVDPKRRIRVPSVRGLVTLIARAATANPRECARLLAPVLALGGWVPPEGEPKEGE